MITTIKQFIKENNSNNLEVQITHELGEYFQGDKFSYDEKVDFCNDAASIILGEMSLQEYNESKDEPYGIYINGILTEYPGEGHKLFNISMTKEELVSELLDNYEDYIYDLDEGDPLIMSTTITLVD